MQTHSENSAGSIKFENPPSVYVPGRHLNITTQRMVDDGVISRNYNRHQMVKSLDFEAGSVTRSPKKISRVRQKQNMMKKNQRVSVEHVMTL